MTTPNPGKGAKYLASLDQALCDGSWSEVPELARKVDKHAPDRQCFTTTARSEARIFSASPRPSSSTSTASSATPIFSDLVQPLKDAISSDSSSNADDKCLARLCLANVLLLQREHEESLKALPSPSELQQNTNSRQGPIGWLEVGEVRATYIRAVCLESIGDRDSTRELCMATVSRAPGSRTPELRWWTERMLALACTTLKKQAESMADVVNIQSLNGALRAFRAWADFWQRAPSIGTGTRSRANDVPRRKVWRAYYDLLSHMLSLDVAYSSSANLTTELLAVPSLLSNEQLRTARYQQFAEVRRVESTYESLLLNETQFPKADQRNSEVETFCAQAFDNFEIFCGTTFAPSDLGSDGKQGVGRRLLDTLYRSTTKTFHSTSILRFLFQTHAWLGEFDLAMNAFNSYMEIISKAKARAEKSFQHEEGCDDDDTAMHTAADAVRILCQYGDREQAENATKVCQIMSNWLQTERPMSRSSTQANGATPAHDDRTHSTAIKPALQPSALIFAYQTIAIGYAHYARLTYKPEERTQLQDRAFEFLQKAQAENTASVETSYYLALSYVENRDIGAAVSTLKSALAEAEDREDESLAGLERHQKLLPLWHLLALCLSSRDEFSAALSICTSTLDSHPTNGRDKDAMNARDKESLLQLHMTQLSLLELTDGVDLAVSRGNELLGGYATLFGTPEKAKEATRPLTTASTLVPPKSRGTLRSIAGSITGRSRSRRNSADSLPLQQYSNVTSTPDSIRTSAETAQRPGTTATATSNGDGAPIQITVTNEEGQAEHQHHRLPFKLRGHHGSAARSKSADSRHSQARSRVRRDTSPPPPLPKGSDTLDYAQPVRSAIERSDTNPRQDIKPIEHNAPNSELPAPAGHEKHPPVQDVRLPAPHPATQVATSMPQHSKMMQRRHSASVLCRLWLFITGLYLRAGSFDDATAAADEAAGLVKALESDVAQSEAGLNARRLFEKGWGGGKSIDALWADVWVAKGSISLAQDYPYEAMAGYEQALLYYPDHPDAIIHISGLLMDIYEGKLPAEEPKILLQSAQSVSSSNLSFPSIAATRHSGVGDQAAVEHESLISGSESSNSKRSRADPSPAELNRLACRDRAYMLLSTLTRLGTGWDNSEAWLALARAHELSGEVKKAKQALWWVVELEESRPVRDIREALF